MNRTNHHSPDRETIQKSGRSSHLATSLATRLAASLVACVLAASALATRLDAATIRILTPQSRTNIPQTHLPEGNHFTTFKSYLENVATLTTGDLEDYTPGSADGIIINLTASNGTYTETEQNKIRTLMTSTTPVLIFGGIGTDFPSNLAQTLAPLLGGGKINSKVSRTTQSVNRDAPAGLIESVDEIKFTNSAYKIEPATLAAGIGVSTEFTLTLWGPNRNILLLLDFMALSSLGTDGGIIQTNKQLAENIAIWLTRPTIIPLATIDTFAANPIPSPTATIGANPATGTTPLSSNLIWNTTDAGSVTITGTGLTSTSLTG
ncbi:MAG: hypothetical protein LBK99_20760, partial [Opitutaceae bacterium]|nr:hypothetical protein [Opitutaceae bacterium]